MGKVIMSGIVPNLTAPIVVDSILNNNSWETIKKISDSGTGSNYWSVGDRKEVVLNGTVGHLTLSNYTAYAFIIGFNHNAELEGNNKIHFQLAKTALSGGTDICFYDSQYSPDRSWDAAGAGYFIMNTSKTNSGGWQNSYMRNTLCGTNLSNYSGTFISMVPEALRAVFKPVTKYTDNTAGGNSSIESYVTSTEDYIFLLAEFEVFGSTTTGNTYEQNKQAQYAYYSAGNSIIKYKYDTINAAAYWWLRSPSAGSANRFVDVSRVGGNDYSDANGSLGFSPAFCV